MKRLLVITYYWPPSGGGGVMRWLKFVRYFRQYGWEPVVYTPENPEMPAEDPSLVKEVPEGITVLKRPVWEPYSLYKRFTGQGKARRINTGFLSERETPSLTEKVSVWIRGNLFIPDARKYWIKPSINFLKQYLNDNPVDAIVSTGPPHSMHLIALGLKESLNIPWVADFRDPWTNIDFYPKLMLTRWADRKHRELEKKVLRSADQVVTVSWSWAEDFRQISGRKVYVITNGYDTEDFQPNKNPVLDEKFSLVHIGAMNADRNPQALWKVLGQMVAENKSFADKLSIRLIGSNDASVIRSLKTNGLMNKVELIPYLPHAQVIRQISTARVLLLPLNDTPNVKGIIPGKLYEYLAAKRPILAIGPADGDSARIIRETNSGEIVGFAEAGKMETKLSDYFTEYLKTGHLLFSGDIKTYSREALTRSYSEILNSLL